MLFDPLTNVVAAADTASSTPIGRRENKIEVKSSKRLEEKTTPSLIFSLEFKIVEARRSPSAAILKASFASFPSPRVNPLRHHR